MVAQVPTTIRTKALVALFTQLERIEKRLTRNTIKDDIALTPFRCKIVQKSDRLLQQNSRK